MFTWLRRNGSLSLTHSTPGITSTTSVGPGGVSQGYRSGSPEGCIGCAFEFIRRNRYVVSYRLSGTRAAAPAEKADACFAIPHGYVSRRHSGAVRSTGLRRAVARVRISGFRVHRCAMPRNDGADSYDHAARMLDRKRSISERSISASRLSAPEACSTSLAAE